MTIAAVINRPTPLSQAKTSTSRSTPLPLSRKKPPRQTGIKGIRLYRGKYKVEVMFKGTRTSGVAETLEEAVLLRLALLEHLQQAVREKHLTMSSSSPSPAPADAPPVSPLALKGRDSRSDWTLEDAIEATFRYIWKGTADENKQRGRTAHLVRFFGPDIPLEEITTERVDAFREWAEDVLKNCPNTINKKVCALSRILRTAHERNKLEKMPKLPQAKVRNGRIRFLTQQEEARLIRSFELLASDDHVDALITLMDTGFRLGELWLLETSNINFQTNTITLWDGTTKNGLARTVPMTARVTQIMKKRCSVCPDRQLWPEKNNWWFQSRWNKVRTALGKDGEKDWVPHMLRHTCCSRLVQAGVNLFVVQRWMGHKSLTITNRYTHLAPEQLIEAKNALENNLLNK